MARTRTRWTKRPDARAQNGRSTRRSDCSGNARRATIAPGMIRLLHTADWHLGATFAGLSRDDDHARFLAWLAETLEARRIDALVIAGDVFDHAQPSADAQRLYFDFLRRIAGTTVRHVSVVGGNHDSPTRLDAPRAVLRSLDVHVVGGLPPDPARWDECIHPIAGRTGGVDAVVLAVPFVHEYRLGVRSALLGPAAIAESFREKFTSLYSALCDTARGRHGDAPLVATGHLAIIGSDRDDAPKDIHQIRSIGGVSPEVFDPRLSYVALGHIHRSHAVDRRPIRYSGSPVATNLREATSPRHVVEVEVDDAGHATVTPIVVPAFRALITVAGSADAVCGELESLRWDGVLPPYVVAFVDVAQYAPSIDERVVAAARTHEARGLRLARIQQRRAVVEVEQGAMRVAAPLRDLTAEQVFVRLCAARGEPVDDALLAAFRDVVSQPGDSSP